MTQRRRPVLAVTIGDPAGIGPEIVLKALQDPEVHRAASVLVVGARDVLADASRRSGLGVALAAAPAVVSGAAGERAVPVLDVANIRPGEFGMGEVSAACGRASVEYVEEAVRLCQRGGADGIVTAPINKEAMKAAGVPYPGHTEILGALFGAHVETMFLVGRLRIFFLSRHMSLRQAIETMSGERLLALLAHAGRTLSELGLDEPRLAVAALNPHAGEHGLFGDEEERVLRPAVAQARNEGWNVVGPIPADSVFHQALQGRYDAVIALYHDQGHIAAKTYDFHGTVSVTTGLPVIRTSVDHGTAFDIAGTGVADPSNMRNALLACADLTARRLQRAGR